MTIKNLVLWLLTAIGATNPLGCGFQLRGTMPLPLEMETVYIKSPSSMGIPSSLVSTLTRLLQSQQVQVVREPTAATVTLEIFEERTERRALAASVRGNTQEYTLIYRVSYQLTNSAGQLLIPKTALVIERDLLFNESQVLGEAANRELLLQDMINELAVTLLRHLQAYRLT